MTPPHRVPGRGAMWPLRVGQIAQGVAMGLLLVLALIGVLALSGHVAAFSYQGY